MCDKIKKLQNYLQKFYNIEEYAALFEQIALWQKSKPFANLKILDATPVFRNTMTKYLALINGGADVKVAISNSIPRDDKIVDVLKQLGISVLDVDSYDKEKNTKFDIILDCAGSCANIDSNFGYVELTRSGLEYYKDCKLPVFLADEGKIKEIETILGTGDGFLRAMHKLGYNNMRGKKAVVFGYGKVGRGVAMYLLKDGADVWIVDDHSKVDVVEPMHKVNCFNAKEIELVLQDAWCVISVTGVKNCWVNMFDINNLIQSNTLIVNMGVEDEFGAQIPEDRVLNNKKPLNFILEEPTQLRYIETTMALHNYGAFLLANKMCSNGLNKPTLDMELPILNASIEKGLIGEEIKLLGKL